MINLYPGPIDPLLDELFRGWLEDKPNAATSKFLISRPSAQQIVAALLPIIRFYGVEYTKSDVAKVVDQLLRTRAANEFDAGIRIEAMQLIGGIGQIFEEAMSSDGLNYSDRVCYSIVSTLIFAGDFVSATTFLEKFSHKFSTRDFNLVRALILFNEGSFRESVSLFHQCKEELPLEYRFFYARSLLNLKEDWSLEQANEICRGLPKCSSKALKLMGRVAFASGKPFRMQVLRGGWWSLKSVFAYAALFKALRTQSKVLTEGALSNSTELARTEDRN